MHFVCLSIGIDIIASFSHVVFAIMERRARRVKTKQDRVFTIFVKRTKLNLLLQIYLPFVEEPAFRFRRVVLVRDTAAIATYCH